MAVSRLAYHCVTLQFQQLVNGLTKASMIIDDKHAGSDHDCIVRRRHSLSNRASRTLRARYTYGRFGG